MFKKPTARVEERLELVEISIDDENLKENSLCLSISSKRGLRNGTLSPDFYDPESKTATIMLDWDTYRDFVLQQPLSILTKVDVESSVIPSIGQRKPTKNRRKEIRQAWKDPLRTPPYKVEVVPIYVFNTTVTPNGIHLGGDSIFALSDCAGRTSAFMDEISEQNSDEKGNILWLLIIDLHGEKNRLYQDFLSRNRDAKRVTKGTTIGVESALLSESGPPSSYGDKLFPSWVVKKLYETSVYGSILQFIPWKFEGVTSKSAAFEHAGNAGSLATAIKDLLPYLKESKIDTEELPEVLNFGLREWYKTSGGTIERFRDKDSRKKGKRAFTTLALKVMILTSVLVYPEEGGHTSHQFQRLLEDLFQQHFNIYGKAPGQYLNKSTKRMTPEKFFTENTYFVDDKFNSGAANTGGLFKQIKKAWEVIIGKQES